MGIDKESDVEANLQIGPTSMGMVRIYVEGEGIEIPMDFEPDEAEDIAEEIKAAAQRARTVGRKGLRDGKAETRIARRVPPQRGMAGELLHHDLATGGGQFVFGGHADDLGIIGVGDHQAGALGQKVGWESPGPRPRKYRSHHSR